MKDRTKPSEYIRSYLQQTGNGHELDDMLSWHDRDPDWEDVLTRVMQINVANSLAGEPPLGVYKPEARAELEKLAKELEQQGR